jgi:hypothetical protein
MWLSRLFSIPTHCYKRCDFLLIGCWELSLTSTFIHPASALQSAAARKALMQDPFQACSNPLTIIAAIPIAPSLVACTLCAGATTKRDALGLLGEIVRPRSRAVPFLAAPVVIGYTARSLATYAGPPRARNATLAVALSGSFLPVIYPCHLPMLVLVVWPGPCCCCSISVWSWTRAPARPTSTPLQSARID